VKIRREWDYIRVLTIRLLRETLLIEFEFGGGGLRFSGEGLVDRGVRLELL
jgi:hypothetical protein